MCANVEDVEDVEDARFGGYCCKLKHMHQGKQLIK